ncbi:MAG: UDP-galactopyranose mutase [Ignavibacteria bacterium]|jgi:UDP-galactopyranose mutase|nr:UDP-galactopyranose mutase [Ignavibacteria bacterium]
MKYDFMIVGAGFAGTVLAERITSELNKKVIIVDKRNHVGGNCYDYYDTNGVLVHKYGPHAFHTNSKQVWEYLSNYTSWHFYSHKVLAYVDGKKIPLPFNFNSLDILFPKKIAERFANTLLEHYEFGTKIPILKMLESQNSDIKFLAEFIYNKVFHFYTIKQWGLTPEELDSSVSSRVPIYLSRDDRYFQDSFQAIPKAGYTALFNNLLSSKNIHLVLNADYRDLIDSIEFDKLIYTGEVDAFFDYLHGSLPYRSLKFDLQQKEMEYFQELAQVNYPNEFDFTRITEFKHFLNRGAAGTTIAIEYPETYNPELNEPYYPVPTIENQYIFEKYKKEMQKLADSVIFLGRLAGYKYYNMDQIVGASLETFEKKIV